jgi:hypothetical protein
VTFEPGFAVSKALPISLNESVNDAAANTVTSPMTFDAAVVLVDESSPQPVTISPSNDRITRTYRVVERMAAP